MYRGEDGCVCWCGWLPSALAVYAKTDYRGVQSGPPAMLQCGCVDAPPRFPAALVVDLWAPYKHLLASTLSKSLHCTVGNSRWRHNPCRIKNLLLRLWPRLWLGLGLRQGSWL